MKLFKKSDNPRKFKFSLFIIFFLMNNLIAIGSENKSELPKNNHTSNKFEEAFFKNTIPYNAYENPENQLKVMLGRWRYPNRSENIYYPDLSIIKNSAYLRELYKSKLNDMIWK